LIILTLVIVTAGVLLIFESPIRDEMIKVDKNSNF